MFLNYFFRIKNSILFYLKKLYILIYSVEFKKFGKNNIVWFPIKIYGKENVSIGNNCGINAFVHIWGGGGVEIGNNVMIASHVSITSLTHNYNSESMRFSEIVRKPVIIEDDVWIGSGAIVLPGIKIGKGAVVGAGSVLTKDVPEFTIVAGNPAKILKIRNIESKKGI